MFNLILFGPPGSGKGTQSERLVDKYRLKHLSTGELLRNEISQLTELGMEAKNFMDKGQLVPDHVVIGMIRNQLESNKGGGGFLFDGFPRTEIQARALDELLQEKDTSINVVLALRVSEEELIKRLLNRGLTSGRVDDVTETVIRERLAEYHRKTSPVANHYGRASKVIYVEGEGSVDQIFDLLCAEIDKRKAV